MCKPAKYALRFLVLIAIVSLVPMLFNSPSPSPGPYVSALSNPVSSPAYAAGCPDKGCDQGISCVSAAGLKCIRFNGKGCTARLCS